MNWVRLGAQLALLVLFLGAGTAAYKILGRPPDPEKVPEGEVPGRAVRAAKVERKDFAAPLAAYGTARAPKIHAVRPLVGGRVVAVGENFLEGRRVSQGELLFQVDAKDLEVAESEASARIREIEATLAAIDDRIAPIDSQIRRLEQELEDQKATLAILARSLELSRKEVDRLNGLFEKNAVSQEELEAGEQRLLAHEEALMVPKSRVNQIPLEVEVREAEKRSIESEREVLAARKAVAEAVLERTRLELGRTRVTSPADGIVLLADPEVRTPVKPLTSEDVLVTGQDVGWIMQSNAGVEIPVSVDFGDVIRIYGGEGTEAGSDLLARLDREGKRGVRVEWYRDGRYWWQGNLDRLRGGLDESTRTVTFIVRVDDTTSAEVAGERVALMRGMFCKVEIPGLVRPDTVVIPRGALREGRTVHLVENGRLTVREVVPQFYSESEIAIESGLSGGETLVLTDVPGAVQGMLLEPVFDPLP